MKRNISFILIAILLLSSFGISTFSASTTVDCKQIINGTDLESVTSVISKEEKILCDATLEDEFEEDSVIVVFKNSKSRSLDTFTANTFSEISAKSVKDLTTRTKNKIFKQRTKAVQTNNESKYDILSTSDEMYIDENDFHQIVKIDLGVKSKENVLACIKKLEERDDVLMACPNYFFKPTSQVIPNDPYFPKDNIDDGQWGSRLIDLPEAWNITTGSNTVKVGVLDSGIDNTHTDLKDRYNSTLSKDFSGGNSPNIDITGHGTQVAGIIGAQGNNGIGPAGVCWNVSLVSLKVTYYNSKGEYRANLEFVADAVDHAIVNNIPILNFSYCGENTTYNKLATALKNYPGLFVCSTTNERENVSNGEYAHYDYNAANTIVVTATNREDKLLEFYNDNYELKGSSYSKTKVHLAAPGDDIWTTNTGGGYIQAYATSMATPYVTGVAALLKSEYQGMDTKAIRDYILSNVDVIPALANKVETGGRLNAYKALTGLKYFSIEFNSNGGSGYMESQSIIYGCATAISNNTYTKAGNSFAGWTAYRPDDNTWYYTNGTTSKWCVEGSQPSGYRKYVYRNGQKVSRTGQKDGRVYLYAQWEPNEINIVFESNNGTSGSMPMLTLVYNTPQSLPANTFTRAGCTFDHWYAKNTDGKLYYTDGSNGGWYNMNEIPDNYTRMDLINRKTVQYTTFDDVTHGETIVLCAYWKPNSGKLGDVDGNGSVSTSDVSTIQKHLNAQLTTPLTTNQLLRADVNFDGSVSVKDTSLIQKYIAQIIDEFGE